MLSWFATYHWIWPSVRLIEDEVVFQGGIGYSGVGAVWWLGGWRERGIFLERFSFKALVM